MFSTLLVEFPGLFVGWSDGQSKSHDDVDDMEIGMTLSKLVDVDVIEIGTTLSMFDVDELPRRPLNDI